MSLNPLGLAKGLRHSEENLLPCAHLKRLIHAINLLILLHKLLPQVVHIHQSLEQV